MKVGLTNEVEVYGSFFFVTSKHTFGVGGMSEYSHCIPVNRMYWVPSYSFIFKELATYSAGKWIHWE